MTKSDQISTFSKNIVQEMHKYCVFWAKTHKQKKRPCEERTTTDPVVKRNGKLGYQYDINRIGIKYGLDLTGARGPPPSPPQTSPHPAIYEGPPPLKLPMDRISPYHGVCCAAFLAGTFFFVDTSPGPKNVIFGNFGTCFFSMSIFGQLLSYAVNLVYRSRPRPKLLPEQCKNS